MANSIETAKATGLNTDAPADQAPSDDEFQTVLARIKAARAASSTPVDLDHFTQAEQEAKQLYQDKADRAEWLSLADKVGNALVRIGAANAGLKAGVDTSQINYGPGNDWEGKIDRYAKDYSTDLGSIDRNRSAALRQQHEEFGLGEKALDTVTKEKGMVSAEKKAADAEVARDARAAAESRARDVRSNAMLSSQENRLDKRLTQQSSIEDTREQRRDRALQLNQLDKQELDTKKQLIAGQRLVNNLLSDSDLGNKSKEKMEMDYGKEAGEAGISLPELQKTLKKEETGLSILGGRKQEEDDLAKRKAAESFLANTRDMLSTIQRRKQNLLQRDTQGQVPAPEAASSQSAEEKVVVQDKDGNKFKLPKAQLQEALKSGYKVAE